MKGLTWRGCGGILALLALLAGPAGAGTISDDFSNPAYSATLWQAVTENGCTAKVEEGVLKLSLGNTGGDWASFANKFTVAGDFVMTVEFNVGGLSGSRGGITFDWPDERWSNEHRYGPYEWHADASWGGHISASVSATEGTFEVKRVGETLTLTIYYEQDAISKAWTRDWLDADVHFGLTLWTGSNANITFDNFKITGPNIVPLPGSALLLGTGLLGLLALGRRRRR